MSSFSSHSSLNQLLAHNKNREQWEPISNILDSTPDETAKRLASIREKHVEEVRQVLQQLNMRRTKEEQAFKAEWERQDKELLDVLASLDQSHYNKTNIPVGVLQSIESSIAVSANEARLIEVERAHKAEVQRMREEAKKTQEAAAQEAKLRADLARQQEEAAKVRAAKEVERLRLEKEADEKRKEEADAKVLGLRPPTAMEELAECDKILSVGFFCSWVMSFSIKGVCCYSTSRPESCLRSRRPSFAQT